MIPIYIFYSMFGFQRTGDALWAMADQMGRGFVLVLPGSLSDVGDPLDGPDVAPPLLPHQLLNVFGDVVVEACRRVEVPALLVVCRQITDSAPNLTGPAAVARGPERDDLALGYDVRTDENGPCAAARAVRAAPGGTSSVASAEVRRPNPLTAICSDA